MLVTWYGQSAFRITGKGSPTVLIDPHGDTDDLAARGMRFAYPSMTGITADLLLITHEHVDHNGAEKVTGEPRTIRSRAGSFETAIGPVTGIASEHDPHAGTMRGDNTIFVFEYDGLRVCHLGDLGQDGLRPRQAEAIGRPDLLFLPVGGGPTIGGRDAVEVIEGLSPRIVIPMHYRTDALDFLEPVETFLGASDHRVTRLTSNQWQPETVDLGADDPRIVVFAPPA